MADRAVIDKIIAKYLPEESKKKKEGTPSGGAKTIVDTRDYQLFLKEHKGKKVGMYEKLCNEIGKLVPVQITPNDKAKMNDALSIIGVKTKPEYVVGLSVIVLFFGVFFSLFLFVLTANIMMEVGGGVATFLAFNYFRNFPFRMVEIRRARASSETILGVLYIVIFMRHTPNLEAAIQFAAENLTGPLSLDFRKLFWDVQTRKYDNIKKALDIYVMKWVDYNRPFVDAVYLIESSIYQRDEYRRLEMLDRAVDRILQGSYENMLHYARELQQPIEMLYMMGIMLPVLGLVMLPIVSTFMGDIIEINSVVILYNVILPIVVFMVGKGTLTKKPVGFPAPDVQNHPQAPPKGTFVVYKNFYMKAWIPAVIVFILLLVPFVMYVYGITEYSPHENDVYVSFLPLAGVGGAIVVYSKLILRDRWYLRDAIVKVEKEFGDAIFQLGNRLSEGLPTEICFEKVAEVMQKSSIAGFFNLIIMNIKKLGMDLEHALFDKKDGAINYYPSPLIRSVMKILLKSSKKSSDVASVSMINVARYLSDIHRIDEKIKDVFGETLASMKFQAAFLTPIVCGIVVGLTAMIVVILFLLKEKMAEMSVVSEQFGGYGMGTSFIMGFFGMSNAIPLHYFQLIVAFYMLEVAVIISYISSQLESQGDMMTFLKAMSSIVFAGVGLYIIITFVTTFLFAGLSKMVVTIGGGIGAY